MFHKLVCVYSRGDSKSDDWQQTVTNTSGQ